MCDSQIEQRLYKYINGDHNMRDTILNANGRRMPRDMKHAILYQKTFSMCDWGGCDLTNLSANGSKIIDGDFYVSKLHNASMQNVLFDGCVFQNCDFDGSNFSNSTFCSSIIQNGSIHGCSFLGSIFDRTILRNSKVTYSTFELAVFQNATFENLILRDLTLNYAYFEDVKMSNVKLPFLQLPYTFNGLMYALNTKDNIYIATSNPEEPTMTIKKYRSFLEDMTQFFHGHDECFPLANCYLTLNELEKAKKANREGITNSATKCDFRMLYFFCIQASRELKLSKKQRYSLYSTINHILSSKMLTQAEYYQFSLYYPKIKRLLFDNPHNKPSLFISLHTNIAANDYKRLGLLMQTLEDISATCGVQLDSNHMEIRHSSPNILDWLPIGDFKHLVTLFQATWATISPILAATLQHGSEVITVLTGLQAFRSYCKKRRISNNELTAERTCNADGATDVEKRYKKTMEEKQDEEKDLLEDYNSVLNARIELLKRTHAMTNAESLNEIGFYDASMIKQELEQRILKLKEEGIIIEEMEVQLLDGDHDMLEHMLYYGA